MFHCLTLLEFSPVSTVVLVELCIRLFAPDDREGFVMFDDWRCWRRGGSSVWALDLSRGLGLFVESPECWWWSGLLLDDDCLLHSYHFQRVSPNTGARPVRVERVSVLVEVLTIRTLDLALALHHPPSPLTHWPVSPSLAGLVGFRSIIWKWELRVDIWLPS